MSLKDTHKRFVLRPDYDYEIAINPKIINSTNWLSMTDAFIELVLQGSDDLSEGNTNHRTDRLHLSAKLQSLMNSEKMKI